ncbi:N-acetyl-gamma-glutamyl-phosphate reductase [Sphingorhabdus soli]|uniref:N-acetyl-gamma-glutamyl-phosphate reductase n=1 Tax=Flavisphingopyxis soli TaxID=2601267 RepID=A0A5C6U6W6_9SPHN|nr:N-acetyl-gamma-glutamyl-phosphate reductase [Sphingorhabdus soli]TXC68667.1 N-acetyl-gamma-glutamyl-phosphate reductase [Sphingorhabdus soli]
MIRTTILGATGYVGAELLRLIAAHGNIEVAHLCGDSESGKPLSAVFPHLALAYPNRDVVRWDSAMLADSDLVLAALPHGASQRLAPEILASGIRFVDLGADFRLDTPRDYAQWYGEAHAAPDLLDTFVYGIPELNRSAIAGAQAVAAAGCFPTAAILALAPLVRAGLIDPASIVVDAASGVTGAGKAPKPETHFDTVDENFAAYGLLTHRHTAEMDMVLGGPVLFTPHLAPMNRGILATCYATACGDGDPLAILADAYADEPFVHVSDTPPSTKWVMGSNAAHVTARRCERTGRILAIAAIDNLGKGAAGQMIQCANIMFGLDENAGLSTIGVWP